MPVTSTYASFHCADLPLATYRADEVVVAAGSRTGRLLFLKEGAVAVIRQGTQIAIVDEPGAVFGEISALLGRVDKFDPVTRSCDGIAFRGSCLRVDRNGWR